MGKRPNDATKGILAEYRRKLIDLHLEAKALISHVRVTLSPYEPEVTIRRTKKAQVSINRLCEIAREIRQIEGRIAKSKAGMGRAA